MEKHSFMMKKKAGKEKKKILKTTYNFYMLIEVKFCRKQIAFFQEKGNNFFIRRKYHFMAY